jgi:ceramide glucosyltransferase
MWVEAIAWTCLAWYVFIATVCLIGYLQLYGLPSSSQYFVHETYILSRLRHYAAVPEKPVSPSLAIAEVPHLTVIRPVKGLEPYLYECLAATFHQDYPAEKLTIYFCISSRDDPAYPVLQRLLQDFPSCDVKIFVEEDDTALAEGEKNGAQRLGPNPKIRNMSRSYREAVGDIVWIIDCNVWVGRGVCGRMVDKLCGMTNAGPVKKYKFVHHLPVCIDVPDEKIGTETTGLFNGTTMTPNIISAEAQHSDPLSKILATGGGRMEEVFLASSHAKMYTAINTVAVAPCILGKSNMFRRSHLNYLTSPEGSGALASSDPATSEFAHARNVGIDHFSYNICEDHLIGDLLWRSSIPNEPSIGNHGLVFGDLAIQPIAGMSVNAYTARRVRWLRVRKFTVTLATLVEPGTESFLCSAYGAFAGTTLPWFHQTLGIPRTWSTFVVLWLLSITIWATVDWTEYILLHSGRTIELEVEQDVPPFARPLAGISRRPFPDWLAAWVGREALALPIWLWAFWGGVTVVWRDRKFWVGMDMKVHEINDGDNIKQVRNNESTARNKSRTD